MTLFDGSIPPRIQTLAIAGSALLLYIVINLIRREKLKEGYSIIWFAIASLMIFFSVFTGMLTEVARLIGVTYVPAALFLLLTMGLLLLSIHFSVLVSKYDKKIRELAQEHALLLHRLETHGTAPATQRIHEVISMSTAPHIPASTAGDAAGAPVEPLQAAAEAVGRGAKRRQDPPPRLAI